MLRILLALLILSGCSTYVADVAPDRMRGMSVVDLVACAGMPSQKMITRKDFFLLEWDQKSTSGGSTSVKSGISFTLPLGTSFTWAPSSSSCHMQVTANRDGSVYDVDFSSSDAVNGMDGACAQLVKQCVYHQSSTGLDPHYDAFEYFFPTDTTSKGKSQ